MDLKILFEDNHCLVVQKPPGISTGRDHRGEASFIERVRACWLEQKAAQPGGYDKKGYLVPVHFLDRPVSGIMLFALSSKAAARLNQAFKSRSIGKIYVALVEGIPPENQAMLQDFLVKDHAKNLVTVTSASSPGAKACQLSYEKLAQKSGYSLLKIRLHTGRSHQIRVQLSHRGWPVAGDVKYGGEKLALTPTAICLHAFSLSFTIFESLPSFVARCWISTIEPLSGIII